MTTSHRPDAHEGRMAVGRGTSQLPDLPLTSASDGNGGCRPSVVGLPRQNAGIEVTLDVGCRGLPRGYHHAVKQKHRYRRKTKGGGLAPTWPSSEPPAVVARRVRYRGSSEHKRRPVHESYDLSPDVRSDASPCPPELSREEAQEALERAIRGKCVSEEWIGAFPKYVWARIGGAPYVARLTNQEQGEYKGWPIEEIELPTDREDRLAPGSGNA